MLYENFLQASSRYIQRNALFENAKQIFQLEAIQSLLCDDEVYQIVGEKFNITYCYGFQALCRLTGKLQMLKWSVRLPGWKTEQTWSRRGGKTIDSAKAIADMSRSSQSLRQPLQVSTDAPPSAPSSVIYTEDGALAHFL